MVFSEYPNMSHMEWVPDESGNSESLVNIIFKNLLFYIKIFYYICIW